MSTPEEVSTRLVQFLEGIDLPKSVAIRAAGQISRMYDDIDFKGARVLDVGGGFGLVSYYAALRGASSVICLEPDAAGAYTNLESATMKARQALADHDVEFVAETLQEFDATPSTFDVVVIHNAINHLDEAACMKLPHDSNAFNAYSGLFEQIAMMSAGGATLAISDCSSKNFFGVLGIRNPFAPTVEWSKHQAPSVWIALMEQAGFAHLSTDWIMPQRLGGLGQVLLGNRFAAYFVNSYFRIMAKKA